MNCPRCRVTLRVGFVLMPTPEGLPDFPGDRYPVTLSMTGTPKLVSCLKCPGCGYSTVPPGPEVSVSGDSVK